jgi:hypothetical protein
MDSKSGVKKTRNDVSADEVSTLLQLLAKADFWSIPSIEDPGPKTDASGHNVYAIDGPHWMVEAVREGSFHYVYRYTPKTSPITEIAIWLKMWQTRTTPQFRRSSALLEARKPREACHDTRTKKKRPSLSARAPRLTDN